MVNYGPQAHKLKPKKEKGHNGTDDDQDDERNKKPTKKAPVCLWPPHKAKGSRHYLKDCTGCPEEKKTHLLVAHAEEMAAGGPAKNTRSQVKKEEEVKATRRIGKPSYTSSSFAITFHDGPENLSFFGRTDEQCVR